MKVIWQALLVFNVLLGSLATYHYFSKKSIDVSILYHEKFNFDKILVQFQENEKVVLDVSKINYFFIFPNNFYCENIKINDKSLPLFFIESTKKDFFSLILSLLNTNEDDIKKSLDKIFNLNPRDNDILNLQKNLQKSFPCANSIQDIEKEITESIAIPDNKTWIHNMIKTIRDLFSNVNLMQDSIENSNENIGTLDGDDLENWKFKMRYIIPAVYLKHNDKDISDNAEFVGDGSYGPCCKVTMQINKSSHENFVLKRLRIRSLYEITIFSHIPIDEQHGFCRPQSLVIDSDGKCTGYLMKYAEFEDLDDFAANHEVKDYRYFYNQLFSVAKAINTLHQKGISHNLISLYNILVCKKDDAEEGNNYYFQLGGFGESHINSFYDYDGNNDDNIPKEHAETKMSKIISSSCSDLSNFINFLHTILASLYLKNVNKSQEEPLMLTMTLKDTCKFDEIESYFKNIDDSFSDIIAIKPSETAECSNLKSYSYKFTETPMNFVALHHTPARCVSYSKGEVLTLDNRFEYKLHSIRYLTYPHEILLDIGIINSINEFYERKYKMKGILVKVEKDDSSKGNNSVVNVQ